MADLTAGPEIIPVGELNRRARLLIERGLPSLWVAGEISNLTLAPSGHWYFTLKDSEASVRCAMFRGRNQFVDFAPANGQQVEVRAQPTLYEARGEFQLAVDAMRRAGLGNLYEMFMKLKARLEAEGLFDPVRKRALPAYPHAIGIVTSPRAAALRDVLTTLKRRWPAARVILYPTPVQGEGAALQLRQAIEMAGKRRDCEVLLLVRGGGSLEDLWAFNDEALARAIAACPIPVVSGVGHETDVTLVDFVADLRTPTPTGAAERVTPDGPALALQIERAWQRLQNGQQRRMEQWGQHVDLIGRRLQHPAERLAAQRTQLGHLRTRLRQAGIRRVAEVRQQFIQRLGERLSTALGQGLSQRARHVDALAAQLRGLNPEAVLQRGYALALDAEGHAVRDAATLRIGQTLNLRFGRGQATSRVDAIRPDKTDA